MHQRTRHASLDFPRSNSRLSPQEEWCEFLSTSMAALTTDEDDDHHDVGSRSLSSLNGLELRRNGSSFEASGRDRLREEPAKVFGVNSSSSKPQRRDSFSESLTSSTGSSPAATAAWRPLGRRASGHIVTSSNQLEHNLEYGFDLPPFAQTNGASIGLAKKKLSHSSSFRDMAHLSSSGSSSLVESSSSDEETGEGVDNNATEHESLRPARIDVDRSFATSPLSSLSMLQEDARTFSMDTRASQSLHVKSPVLSSRKDSQTWQLQDEELLTSPRFGQFHAPLDGSAASMFGGGMGLFAEEANNNQASDHREARTRVTKDARASSVDFTYVRPADLNPPLPPQEPQLQRLRARSFSYSAGFGGNNYNPAFVNKQYIPQHPSQPEFPVTMRQFHAGAPPPPQPTTMGSIRPPRVSIPPNEVHAYHQHQPQHQIQHPVQHQSVTNQQYRRYSTDFVAPPYPDQLPQHEPDVQLHRTPSGRGIRSYSMEYFQQTNQRVRTHSLEGNQMFTPVAPTSDYPILNRHGSGAVSYEWPRSPVGGTPLAPPLPPDTRMGVSSQFPPPPPEAYYEVEFKRGRTEFFAGNAGFNPGEFVKVEADRGEDIGRVLRRVTDISKITGSPSVDQIGHGEETLGRTKRHELPSKRIISVANARECDMLSEQRKEEHEVYEVCKSKVRQRLLPMNVIDAEYQFDRHKLTFFFEADRRIDFRELVRDLFAIYKTRIWLQQVVPTGKKPMSEVEINN